MTQLPAVSLAAVPGRRLQTIEIAKEIEKKGFPGIFGPSLGDSLSLCNAIALATTDVMIGTSIPLYIHATLPTSRKQRAFCMKCPMVAFVLVSASATHLHSTEWALPQVSHWETCESLLRTCTRCHESATCPLSF